MREILGEEVGSYFAYVLLKILSMCNTPGEGGEFGTEGDCSARERAEVLSLS
jgi:hypothetical protein